MRQAWGTGILALGLAAGLAHPVPARAGDAISVRSLEPRVVAYLQGTGSLDALPASLGRLRQWASQAGVEAAGAPSAVYYADPATTPPEAAFWEVRLPLSLRQPPPAPPRDGGVGVIRTEPIRAAACSEQVGLPGGRGPAVEALRQWAAAHRYRVNGPLEETFLEDPGSALDRPVRTRLCLPVVPPR
jgi:effector-binding domain-containing protein